MVIFRRALLLVLGLLLTAFVVACGGTPNPGTNSSNAQDTMTTQTAKPADRQTNHDQKIYQQVIPNATQSKNNQQIRRNGQLPPAPTKTLISTKQVNVLTSGLLS